MSPDQVEIPTGGSAGKPGPAPRGQLLGDLLMARGLATEAQVEAGLAEQQATGRRLGAILVDQGVVDAQRLMEIVSEQLDVPTVDLGQHAPEADVLSLVPEVLARELGAVPVRWADGVVEVAVTDTLRPGIVDQLKKALGAPVVMHLASEEDVRRMIDASYRVLPEVEQHVQTFLSGKARRSDSGDDAEAPVSQIVRLLLLQARRDRASDVHLEPLDNILRVRFRIDGRLHEVLRLPKALEAVVVNRIKVLANMDIIERRRPQDGQMTVEVEGLEVDVRVSTITTIWGEKCVLRLLDQTRRVLRLQDLGLPGDTGDALSTLAHAPYGLVIVAGPTGSGKTTTLYALVQELDDPERNIVTLEDPVEYVFPSISQVQLNEQADVTFGSALRAILRQDPDVILIGEMRDAETCGIAVQSSLTGHLVMSSIHAIDTASAVHRLLDLGVEPFLLASSLTAVVAQRLVRRSCQRCRTPYAPTVQELTFFEAAGGDVSGEFWAGRGCNFCAGTGFFDRIGVYELLRVTPEIRRLVMAKASQEEVRQTANAQGMRTLLEEAVTLVRQGVTTVGETMRAVYSV